MTLVRARIRWSNSCSWFSCCARRRRSSCNNSSSANSSPSEDVDDPSKTSSPPKRPEDGNKKLVTINWRDRPENHTKNLITKYSNFLLCLLRLFFTLTKSNITCCGTGFKSTRALVFLISRVWVQDPVLTIVALGKTLNHYCLKWLVMMCVV